MSQLKPYLEQLRGLDGSDLFFSADAPVHVKVEGRLRPLAERVLSATEVDALARSIMSSEQIAGFARRPELNLGLSLEGGGRFRVNIYRQRGSMAMVVRYLRDVIPSLESLNLPLLLQELIMKPRGLLLVVGGTGSGKSTALASMIDYRNQHSAGHILCIEDPIEYLHRHKRSLVDQREVGIDTLSYEDALKNAMREAPDVIMIGEIRDKATMQNALAYAETGHLCISTLHANNVNQALERIITFFPHEQHDQLYMDLSLNLRACVSLRLVPGVDGLRVPAVEIMINSPLVSDLIRKGDIAMIREVIERDDNSGSQSFDEALYALYRAGRITHAEAMRHAESVTNLRLRIQLEEAGLKEGLSDRLNDLTFEGDDD